MDKVPLREVMRSHYCKGVFLVSSVLVYFLVPSKIWYGLYSLIGVVFILSTAALITCIVRALKEKLLSSRASGASFFGILSTVVGLGALQTCSIGAPICGASVGAGIVAFFVPGFTLHFLEDQAVLVICGSIVFQLVSLYLMHCFYK